MRVYPLPAPSLFTHALGETARPYRALPPDPHVPEVITYVVSDNTVLCQQLSHGAIAPILLRFSSTDQARQLSEEQQQAWVRQAHAILVEWNEANISLFLSLRQATRAAQVPLVALCARSFADPVAALVVGADDVISEPFNWPLVEARLRAYQRHHATDAAPPVAPEAPENPVPQHAVTGEALWEAAAWPQVLHHDAAIRQFWIDDRAFSLTAREYELLAFLVEYPDMCHTREHLLTEVWGFDFDPGTNLIDTRICKLRRKLKQAGLPPLIATVRGTGYRLSLPVSDEATP